MPVGVPPTTRIVWKGRGAESTLLSTFRQDFSPPYAVSREAVPWSQLPRSPPLPSRPTVLSLVPNFHDPHSANSMKPVLDEWPACLACWPSATRPRSIRTSILSSESSTHPPEPATQSTMVRKRKERVVRSAEYYEEQERRRTSQRTAVNLWRKGTRISVEGERRRWNKLVTDWNAPYTVY
jgi:hypothetical protein